MNDTFVTVVGNVASSPERKRLENGTVTNFRLASTARRFDAASQQWVDAATFWIDVECWRELSGNVAASLSKGDPVIVRGALSTRSWESDAGPRSKPQLRAFSVGPDLSRCIAEPQRKQPRRSAVAEADGAGADAARSVPSQAADGFAAPFGPEADGLLPGRDYQGAEEVLDRLDTDDLDPEPVRA